MLALLAQVGGMVADSLDNAHIMVYYGIFQYIMVYYDTLEYSMVYTVYDGNNPNFCKRVVAIIAVVTERARVLI